MIPCLGSVALYSKCPVGSSGTASPITQAGYSRCVLCVGCYTLLLQLSLDRCWQAMGGIYLGQSAARTGYDQGPPTSTLHGVSAVQSQGGDSLT